MQKKTFFIIEDHTVTNIGLKALIKEKTDAECLGSAFTKSEAEEKLANLSQLPDIVILDLYLGKESSLELLKIIRGKYPSVKVLVYSMYSKPGILSITLEQGAHGFVDKSAPESILITAIKNILSGEPMSNRILSHPCLHTRPCMTALQNRSRESSQKYSKKNQSPRLQMTSTLYHAQ